MRAACVHLRARRPLPTGLTRPGPAAPAYPRPTRVAVPAPPRRGVAQSAFEAMNVLQAEVNTTSAEFQVTHPPASITSGVERW